MTAVGGVEPAIAGPRHDAEVDFALELARQAGGVLMDRYERLERIDYKSARDVVTDPARRDTVLELIDRVGPLCRKRGKKGQ